MEVKMKKSTVKSAMEKLVSHYGGEDSCHGRSRGIKIVSEMLGIQEVWAYRILKGKVKPGGSLWKLMQHEVDKLGQDQ